MTIYAKPAVGPAWGETAHNPADIITVSSGDVSTGWTNTGTPPSRQRFNYLINWAFKGIRYFMQRGLADYDAAEAYQIGARIIGDDGRTYTSATTANIGNTPSTSPAQWTPWGFTIAQINAAQITQANISGGDNSSKVANTNFVTTAITAVSNALTTAYTAADTVINNALTAAVSALNTAIAGAITTAEAYVIAGMGISLNVNNGYIRLPTWASGFTLQWALGTATSGNNTQTVYLPVAFAHVCLSAIATPYLNSGTNISKSWGITGWSANSVSVELLRRGDEGSFSVSPIVWAVGY